MIPINHGMIGSDSIPIISGKCETSGSNWRRLSISFSQEIIWFEVGMLWDAKAINHRFVALLAELEKSDKFRVLSIEALSFSAR